MPFWLLILLGAGLVYLVKQGQNQAAQAPALALTSSSSAVTTSYGAAATDVASNTTTDAALAEDFGPTHVSPLASGSSFTVPSGTALFSDNRLTQSAGTSSGQVVTVTGHDTSQGGSISVSYQDPLSGKTMWFAQPGT